MVTSQKIIIAVGLAVVVWVFISSCQQEVEEAAISYNTHIRPILSDKCFKCHGPDKQKRLSDYRLDTPEGAYAALKDQPDKHGIVPGEPESSDVMHRITSSDPAYLMPPPEENLALTTDEIDLIRRWIAQGARYEQHWAWLPVTRPPLPAVEDRDRIKNEIDLFVQAKIEEAGLTPAEEETPERLLKRVLHDLTGLPPDLAAQDAFLQAPGDEAYEKIVNQALASPHYGEKMAILWMDIARYADSHGYQDDGLRTMWPWRDWVIHAFNSNYSYRQFVTWQLAGDLLPDQTRESLLATGFNRNHKITQEGGVIDEEYRIEYVTDRTNTFGKGLLAMTFECAKCHDHKYDPISQEDYFRTFAFFNQVPEKGLYGDISIASLADPPYMTISQAEKDSLLTFISQQDTMDVQVMIMQDSSILRPTHILERGVYDRKGAVVSHGTPAAILPFDTSRYEANRLGLAEWMFDPKHPLTARVFVNLLWQEFFGRGIVATAGDFGLQGDLPSHPELLDWLAHDFVSHGWDIKRLVKQIVMSATYRQSAVVSQEALAVDPDNLLLARGPRQKLSAELLNDHILASSGLLHTAIGGPSVKPYQPAGLWESATSGRGQLATYVRDEGEKLYRRGLYHFIKRTVPPPAMLIFDASNRDQCEVQRTKTNTPLQSLVLMNDERVLEASRVLAARLMRKNREPDAQLTEAFRRIVCRRPNRKELAVLREYFQSMQQKLDPAKAEALLAVGEKEIPIEDPVQTTALMQTVQLMYNLEETSMR